MLALTGSALATIHPGDELQVRVYNHADLSRSVHVGARGDVSLPLVGTIDARGLDERALAVKIALALRPYVVAPAVDVEVIAQGSTLFVSGSPGGVLKYVPGETLMAAIADLQSPQPDAAPVTAEPVAVQPTARSRGDLHNVAVLRDGKTFGTYDAVDLQARGQSGPDLEPGDIIAIANKPVAVRVIGDVARPGYTYLALDDPLSEAIAQAGGVDPSAASGHVIVNRAGVKQDVALGDPMFAEPAMPGETITVPVAPRVNVVGVVEKPGQVVLKNDFTLLGAIYDAGGPTKAANLKDVQIVHDGVRTSYDISDLTHGVKNENPELVDGDMVFVPDGHKIDFGAIIQALASVRFII